MTTGLKRTTKKREREFPPDRLDQVAAEIAVLLPMARSPVFPEACLKGCIAFFPVLVPVVIADDDIWTRKHWGALGHIWGNLGQLQEFRKLGG